MLFGKPSARGAEVSEEPGLDLWFRLLVRRFRFIAAVGLASGALTLLFVLFLPRWYTARATVLPPHQESASPDRSSALGIVLQLGSVLPFVEGVTLKDVYLAILDSDTVAGDLVDRFDLRERYKQKTERGAIATLRSHAWIAPRESRLIEVKVEDKDPQMAADLTNGYLEELDRVFRETRSSGSRREREFLEGRCEEARAELDSMGKAFAALQVGGGVAVLSNDLREAAETAGNLLGRRASLKVRIDMLQSMGLDRTPMGQAAELELEALEREIAKLPALGQELAQELRDLRLREVLYNELTTQLEAARIEEARNTPAVEVLDPAVPPTRHSRPRRGLTAIAGAMTGAAVAFFWVVVKDPERPGAGA